jgi:hypothetical protein
MRCCRNKTHRTPVSFGGSIGLTDGSFSEFHRIDGIDGVDRSHGVDGFLVPAHVYL